MKGPQRALSKPPPFVRHHPARHRQDPAGAPPGHPYGPERPIGYPSSLATHRLPGPLGLPRRKARAEVTAAFSFRGSTCWVSVLVRGVAPGGCLCAGDDEMAQIPDARHIQPRVHGARPDEPSTRLPAPGSPPWYQTEVGHRETRRTHFLRAVALPPFRPAAFFCAVVPPCFELPPLPDALPPRLDAPGELAMRAARSFDIPLSFSASYCFAFLTLGRLS